MVRERPLIVDLVLIVCLKKRSNITDRFFRTRSQQADLTRSSSGTFSPTACPLQSESRQHGIVRSHSVSVIHELVVVVG